MVRIASKETSFEKRRSVLVNSLLQHVVIIGVESKTDGVAIQAKLERL